MQKMNTAELDTFLTVFKNIYLSEDDTSASSLLLKLAMGTIPNIKPKDLSVPKFKFTLEEIRKMPKTFRKEFRADHCTAHIRKIIRGKHAELYEIRYRRNGYNISVTSKYVDEAKRKFIEKLKTATPAIKNKEKQIPTTLHSFAMYYFETFRIKKVTPKTYSSDLGRYNKHIKDYFGEKEISKIRPDECQDLLDEIKEAGKGKTADEVRSLLMVIFKSAIAFNIISRNPLDMVVYVPHERNHGKALTKEEEKLLFDKTKDTPYQLMFAIALYTGLRPNEYETARREGDFIIARNSKRKNGREELKKIPISPMLAPYIKDTTELTFYKPYTLREKINELLPNHILYDLRTTFYSRCKECGVSDTAIKKFAGHSLGKLEDAYTDLSDEYIKKESSKIKY